MPRITRAVALALAALLCTACTHQIPATEIGTRYQIIGELDQPLGTAVFVGGTIFDSDMKELAGVPCIRIKSVNRHKIDGERWLPLYPLIGKLPALEVGRKYYLYGYEDGGFSGTPETGLEDVDDFQTKTYGFSTHFVVLRVKKFSDIVD